MLLQPWESEECEGRQEKHFNLPGSRQVLSWQAGSMTLGNGPTAPTSDSQNTVVPRIAIAPFYDEIALRWTFCHCKSNCFAMAPMEKIRFAMIAGERSPAIIPKAPFSHS